MSSFRLRASARLRAMANGNGYLARAAAASVAAILMVRR
jgi:hypothetical protein